MSEINVFLAFGAGFYRLFLRAACLYILLFYRI